MSGLFLSKGLFPEKFFRDTVSFIRDVQLQNGCIPWFEGGHADPWDHIEAAMGLSIGGEIAAAEQAYAWLAEEQLPNGGWWASYRDGKADQDRCETNFVAYIATGVWHHYLITQDRGFLQRFWPVVANAMDFVLTHQSEHCDMAWGVDRHGTPMDDALITGCSSIYKSLECACNIAAELDRSCADWLAARQRLGNALRFKPQRFDREEDRRRFSMDWFYPVMTGVVPKPQARAHLLHRWEEFVEPGKGCRCVSDEPWVTVAESCELTMALLAAGDHPRAVNLYSWLHEWRARGGEYWTGYQMELDILWPEEAPTWTSGAVLLAADALTAHTSAHQLFTAVSPLLEESDTQTDRASSKQRLR